MIFGEYEKGYWKGYRNEVVGLHTDYINVSVKWKRGYADGLLAAKRDLAGRLPDL